jgi:L-fuconolactonase
MPDPVIDAHLHLWDPQHLRYGWLAGNALLNRRYALPEFRAATATAEVAGAVFVQCDCEPGQSFAEAEWVTRLAVEEPRIRGIVARAALERGAAVRTELAELATLPLVRGIRRIIQGEKAGFCAQPDFVAGVKALAEFGLSADLCLRRDQLGEAAELVRACPEVRFVLDHGGNPDIAGKQLEPWASDIAAIARLPNAVCKLSGLVTNADKERWTVADLAPTVDHLLTAFGPTRLLFGGDWPVVLMAASYQRWADAARELLAQVAPADRRRILHDNAIAVYRL